MDTAILAVHILVCIILVILVLLQAGKDGMGVIFGGGSSSSGGSVGAGGLLTKLTASLAVIFVCTSLFYNIITGSSSESESTLLDVQFEETPLPTDVQAQPPLPIEEASPVESSTEVSTTENAETEAEMADDQSTMTTEETSQTQPVAPIE